MKFLSPFRNDVSQSRQTIDAGDTVIEYLSNNLGYC